MTKPIPTRPMPQPKSVQSVQSPARVTSLALPPNCPRSVRVAIALQLDPSPLPSIPCDVDAVLLPYLPDHGAEVATYVPTATAVRSIASLTSLTTPAHETHSLHDASDAPSPARLNPYAVQLVATPDPVTRQPLYSFAPPPHGVVSRVERVLWPQMGIACVRAVAFLVQWQKLGYWKDAAKACGVDNGKVNLWRDASPAFGALYDAFRSGILASRHNEAEDTLHKLANGEIEGRKDHVTKDGEIVNVSTGNIYSEKALSIELAAQDRARYGGGVAGTGTAIQVNISVTRPDWAGDARKTQAEQGATVESVEWIEA